MSGGGVAFLRIHTLLLCVWALGPAAALAENFPLAEVLEGRVAAKQDCQPSETAIWVRVGGRGECVRFFSAGLAGENPVAVVAFHGDRLWKKRQPDGSFSLKVVKYRDNSSDALLARVRKLAEASGLPHILIARPGTYGSSGDHRQRRRPREVRIVNAALAKIKQRYGIGELALVGQSGGGHLVASLLAEREDVTCAVTTSGVVAVGLRINLKGWSRDITGYSDFHDPIEQIARIPHDSERRIFVVGDPRDQNVPFETQVAYHARLQAAGHAASLIEARAGDRMHHNLEALGLALAGTCARKAPTQEILETAIEAQDAAG